VPTAFVSGDFLRVFDNFGASGNYVSQLRRGDRVQVLAQSADGVWTQIRSEDGYVGWGRTDHLVMASASYAHGPIVQAPLLPDILFADDFQDPQSGLGSPVGETGEMYYRGGEYVIRVWTHRWTWRAFYPQSYMDCEIEVEVRISHIRAALYGLVFRFLEDNGYYFVIDPVGGYALGKIEAGEWTRITYYFAQSDAIHEGQQTNRLRLRVDGSQISLYANDELLETVNDTMFDGGQIGLMVKHDSG